MTIRLVLGLCAVAVVGVACNRDSNQEATAAVRGAGWVTEPLAAVRTSDLVAGGAVPTPAAPDPYKDDEASIAQGRQIYAAFNCGGCHGSEGGGGIGPPFADADWIYGGEPANIYASVVQGRPNGMPAFGARMTGEPVWKIAAFVRSLGPGEGKSQNDSAGTSSQGR